MFPVFRSLVRFRRAPVVMSMTSAGASLFQAVLRLKRAMAGQMDGASTTSANMRVKRGMRLLSQGAGTLSGDLTVFHPTVLHILVTGQSNAVGANSTPLFTTGTIAGGVKFNGGLRPGSTGGNLTSFVALQEETSTVDGETGMGSLVRWLNANILANYIFLVSDEAVNSAAYSALAKGTTPYNNHMAQITAAKAVALAAGLQYRVLCVVAIHGETDEQASNASYRTQLATWQSDYQTDAKAITGQAQDIPMFHAQQGAYGPRQYNAANLDHSSAIQLLQAHLDNPTKVILAAPESPFDFYALPHFSAFCHAWLGEFFAKAIKRVCFDGLSFSPIRMTAANISGSQIIVDFSVPTPPIQLNFRFSNYADGAGFRFDSSAGALKPTAAAVTGPSQITLTFASAPGGTSKRLSFATDDTDPKITRSADVCDSDATAGYLGMELKNRMPAQYIDIA